MNTRARLLALILVLTGALLSVPSAVAIGGHRDGRAAGQERFLILNNNPRTNANSPVAGFGPIHAKGTDKVLTPHRDRFIFPKGSVVVRHSKTSQSQHYDKANCYGRFTETGTWKVVRGTRTYRQASGGGTYRVKGQLIGCSQNRPPKVFQLQINAVGRLKY
jgi:hypothetical protein